MYRLPIESIPNQVFTVVIDNITYRCALRNIQNLTFMSVWADGDLLFYNQLCVPNSFVNPYNYLSINGKFYFRCINNDYPFFKNFGVTQELLFYTAEEVIANA